MNTFKTRTLTVMAEQVHISRLELAPGEQAITLYWGSRASLPVSGAKMSKIETTSCTREFLRVLIALELMDARKMNEMLVRMQMLEYMRIMEVRMYGAHWEMT